MLFAMVNTCPGGVNTQVVVLHHVVQAVLWHGAEGRLSEGAVLASQGGKLRGERISPQPAHNP
jgi:hypothetical protein